jgi:ADP-heptose:LPS heptosyltransferase
MTPSPLRGKYLMRNPWGNLALHAVDTFLPSSKAPKSFFAPDKILLSNLSHLGDVVIATSVLPVIKTAFPKAKIGFLLGSWAKGLLKGHPLVNYVHTVDHWKLNRSELSFWKKLLRYSQSGAKAIEEIKEINYSAALDLYTYFPNAAPLFWRCGIPIRIGYTSGGFGSFFTHSLEWSNSDQHVSNYYWDLLKALTVEATISFPLFPNLPPIPDEAKESLYRKFPFLCCEKGFIIFHMGTESSLKSWPKHKWVQLAEKFVAEGYFIVFTGQGKEEEKNIRELCLKIPHTIDLCNLVMFEELAFLLQNANLLVSIDSMIAHFASVFKLPSLVFFNGIDRISHWRPQNPNCSVFLHKVPCSPCYNKKGCQEMSCIREISLDAVFEKGLQLLKNL